MDSRRPDSTPLQYDAALAGNSRHRTTILTNAEVQIQLAQGMKCRWIGPVPVRELMAELMPIDDEKLEEYNRRRDNVKFKSLKSEKQKRTKKDADKPKEVEKDLYTRFSDAIQQHDLSPCMPFFISADKKKTNKDLRPDGGLERKKKDEEEEDEEDDEEEDDEEEDDEEAEKKKEEQEAEEKELHLVQATHRYATRSKTARALSTTATEANTAVLPPKKAEVSGPRPFNWCLDTLVVEFKAVDSDDPFLSETSLKKQLAKVTTKAKPTTGTAKTVCFEKSSTAARKIRGQLALYAREMFNHQQRTHIFQLLVAGDIARIIYFDHAGAIVSERIDYVKDGGTLGEFFWRFNHMTDKARGVDLTAMVAKLADKEMFTSVVKELVANMENPSHPQRSIPDARLTLDPRYPVYKMSVHEGVPRTEGTKDGSELLETESSNLATMELLVQRPIFDAPSPIGRATRGYIAVPATTKKAVTEKQELDSAHSANAEELPATLFLKDTWRVDHALLKAESEVYRLLEKYGVERIPRLVCGGDVRDADGQVQRTIGAEWAERLRRNLGLVFADLRTHLHHRLVQRLAYPIESAKTSEEMVRAFYDVLGVIEEAYEKMPTKVLHRDVSIGNVMLGDKKGEKVGVLADWDHASETKPEGKYEHQLFRTGTWPFMSIALLMDPSKAHEILDDLEALFWTLLYAALNRFEHTSSFNMSIFNDHDFEVVNGIPTGRIVGGSKKKGALSDIPVTVEFTSQPLQSLITTLSEALSEYYHSLSAANARKKVADKNPNNTAAKRSYDAALKQLNERHAMLSKPSYWRELFKEELEKKDAWPKCEAAPTVLYPPRTKEQGFRLFEASIATSAAMFGPNAPTNATTPTSNHPVEEAVGNPGDDVLSCDEGNEGDQDEILDATFVPLPEAGTVVGTPDIYPSPTTTPSHQLQLTTAYSFESDSSEEEGPASPSRKRTHEDLDVAIGGPSLKRYRSEGLPRLTHPPPAPLQPIVSRRSRQPRAFTSGEVHGNVPSRSK